MMQHDEKYHTNQLNTTKIINIVPQYSKILQNTAKHLQIVPIYHKILQYVTKYLSIPQNTQHCPKIQQIETN